MFAKLLKHEFKATGRLLGILSGAALAVGVIGGLLLRNVMNSSADLEVHNVISVVSAVATPFILLSLFAYAFGGEIYLAVQFYKRKFTDQGYLTFTLPVRTWQIYLSSLINILLWTLVISIVTIVAFVCTLLIGVFDTEVWHRLIEAGMHITLDIETMLPDYAGWRLMDFIFSFVSGNVLLLTSITVGCVVAKRHRVLSSIASFYLISLVFTAVGTMLTVWLEPTMEMIYLLNCGLDLFAALVGSVLSVCLMEWNLNLP